MVYFYLYLDTSLYINTGYFKLFTQAPFWVTSTFTKVIFKHIVFTFTQVWVLVISYNQTKCQLIGSFYSLIFTGVFDGNSGLTLALVHYI